MSSSARPASVLALRFAASSGICSALLNGVTCSTSRACISVVLLVRLAITIEMPIDEPMLRTSVKIEVPLLRRWLGRVKKAAVVIGTNNRPRPMPWTMLVTTMVRWVTSSEKPVM